MQLHHLKKEDIKNILIYVCDSLRWDYTPKVIFNKGIGVKTIASSLYTAPSFPCLISGLYPNKTGVYNWQDILKKELRGLFNFRGYNSSLWCETTWTDLPPGDSDLHHVLGRPFGISLKEIKEPFVYIEDDKGGHCPYGIDFGHYETFDQYYKEVGKYGNDELRTQYKKSIETSIHHFENRLQTLNERGLEDNTLVIFTSDHGELLGEYGGLVDHGRPPCPELIYVPTVFIHPSIAPEKIDSHIIRHIDIFPTIASLLNEQTTYTPDGIDLTNQDFPKIGMNFRIGGYFHPRTIFDRLTIYQALSIWDSNGGHSFQPLNKNISFAKFLFMLISKHPEFTYFHEHLKYQSKNKLNDMKTILKTLTQPHYKYGQPSINKKEAKNLIDSQQQESLKFSEKMKIDRMVLKILKDKHV